MGITLTPAFRLLTKMKFNALLDSKHLEQCRCVVSKDTVCYLEKGKGRPLSFWKPKLTQLKRKKNSRL